MKLYRFDSELWLPQRREKVFEFFADARNLETITPEFLSFHVITPSPIRMQPGARIEYRLRVHGLPFRWESEITTWELRGVLLMNNGAGHTGPGVTSIVLKNMMAERDASMKWSTPFRGGRFFTGFSSDAISNGSSGFASRK